MVCEIHAICELVDLYVIIMPVSDPKKSVILIAAATVLAGFSFLSLLIYTDPVISGVSVFVFLYASVFLLSLGCLTLGGLAVRRVWMRGLFNANLANSFRQGLLLSFFIIVCLILSAYGILYWWVGVSLILPVIATESFLNLKL